MSFKIHRGRYVKHAHRREELLDMFEKLWSDHDTTAKIDLRPSVLYSYATKLGYKIHVHDNRDGTSIVWVGGKKATGPISPTQNDGEAK